MSAYSAALAWEFRRRHRWGLIALAGYFSVLAAIKFVIIAPGLPIRFDSDESFALTVVVPLTATFTYFLAVFSFGYVGDLAARQSMYPTRMFALPVTSAALTGWPMLYGALAMATLWCATRVFAIWPSGFDIPYVWPGLLAASLMAWTQALVWMPYPLSGLRVIVTVLWLAMIDAIVLLALYSKPHELVMLAIIALYLVLGCFVETLTLMIATTPIVVPIIKQLGYSPVWFGVVFVILIEAALITPPIGMNLFVVQSVRGGGPFRDVALGIVPFLIAMLVLIGALIAWPDIALWLPALFAANK